MEYLVIDYLYHLCHTAVEFPLSVKFKANTYKSLSFKKACRNSSEFMSIGETVHSLVMSQGIVRLVKGAEVNKTIRLMQRDNMQSVKLW